jgi:hypothetical protein
MDGIEMIITGSDINYTIAIDGWGGLHLITCQVLPLHSAITIDGMEISII